MCHLDRTGGRQFGNSKLWMREVGKSMCAGQWEFRHPRRGKSVQEK